MIKTAVFLFMLLYSIAVGLLVGGGHSYVGYLVGVWVTIGAYMCGMLAQKVFGGK